MPACCCSTLGPAPRPAVPAGPVPAGLRPRERGGGPARRAPAAGRLHPRLRPGAPRPDRPARPREGDRGRRRRARGGVAGGRPRRAAPALRGHRGARRHLPQGLLPGAQPEGRHPLDPPAGAAQGRRLHEGDDLVPEHAAHGAVLPQAAPRRAGHAAVPLQPGAGQRQPPLGALLRRARRPPDLGRARDGAGRAGHGVQRAALEERPGGGRPAHRPLVVWLAQPDVPALADRGRPGDGQRALEQRGARVQRAQGPSRGAGHLAARDARTCCRCSATSRARPTPGRATRRPTCGTSSTGAWRTPPPRRSTCARCTPRRPGPPT